MNKLIKYGELIMGVLTVVGGLCEIGSWIINNKMEAANNEIPDETEQTRT